MNTWRARASTTFIGLVFALTPTGISVEAGQTRSEHTATNPVCQAGKRLTDDDFKAVMREVADAWNRGDAQVAASCFTEEAIYSGPPSSGHRGRKALYDFFGGAKGRELPMHMEWHNLIFDAKRQVGAGEYTFRYRIQTHGLVIVNLRDGLIRNWREYEVESNLPWDEFVGENRF